MFGAFGGVLQQVATGLTTGTVPLAIATIAIAIVGYAWAVKGWMQAGTAAAAIIGIAIAGGAATIAPMLIAG
jgi:hypothetical protein